MYILISRWILFIRNVSDKSRRENQYTILCSRTFFFPWKWCRFKRYVQKYGRVGEATGDNIIMRMGFACWITKATNTNWEYVILIAFPRQQLLLDRASTVTFYVHCLSCWNKLRLFSHTKLIDLSL